MSHSYEIKLKVCQGFLSYYKENSKSIPEIADVNNTLQLLYSDPTESLIEKAILLIKKIERKNRTQPV